MSQQILTAMLFGGFALGFALFWSADRRNFGACFFALSYLSASIGFFLEYVFSISESLWLLTPIGDMLYLISPALLAVGLSIHFKQKLPDLLLSLIFLGVFLKANWFWFVIDDFVKRTEIISYGCAALAAVGAYMAFRGMQTLLERALFTVLSIFSAQFVVTTLVAVYIKDDSANSHYIDLLHLGVAVVAIALAVLLYAVLGADLKHKGKDATGDPSGNLNSSEALQPLTLRTNDL